MFLIGTDSVLDLPFKSSLTLCDGACSTSFREAIALSHWAAEAYIHKSLSGWGQRCSSGQHHPHSSPEQFLDFPE